MPCPHRSSPGKNKRNKKRAHVPRCAPSNLVSHSPSMPSLTRHQCHRRPAAPVLPRNYIQRSSHNQHHHTSPAGVPPPITNLPARPSPARHGITKRPEYRQLQPTHATSASQLVKCHLVIRKAGPWWARLHLLPLDTVFTYSSCMVWRSSRRLHRFWLQQTAPLRATEEGPSSDPSACILLPSLLLAGRVQSCALSTQYRRLRQSQVGSMPGYPHLAEVLCLQLHPPSLLHDVHPVAFQDEFGRFFTGLFRLRVLVTSRQSPLVLL